MTQLFVDVPLSARVNPQSGSEPVGPATLNRRALRAGTAIPRVLFRVISPASAFVAPPIDGLPAPASHVPEGPPSLRERIRRLMRTGPAPGSEARRNGRTPRLLPTDAGRHVNAMPGHAMAAGGRPLIMKIPGK